MAPPTSLAVSLASLTLPVLKARCTAQGLSVSGKKADLVERLEATGRVPSPSQVAFENKLMVSEEKVLHRSTRRLTLDRSKRSGVALV